MTVVMHRLSVKYRISALSAQKSNYQYGLNLADILDVFITVYIYSYFGGKTFVFLASILLKKASNI